MTEQEKNKPLRLLLVDDDPQILTGLTRRIAGLREDWVVLACPSVDDALENMRCDPPDALVTDLKMPGQHGVNLLERARAMSSACFRVVLSGCAEKDLIMHSLDLSHRFFPKPCDASVLVGVIEAGVAELNKVDSVDLRSWVAGNKSLPAVPRLYNRITALLNSPSTSTEQIAKEIEMDPSIAAKLLRSANSAYFGWRQGVNSVHDAVGFVGVDAVKSLVLGCEVFASATSDGWMEELWEHSILVSAVASKIARQLGTDTDSAATAGLLHDVGKIILSDSVGHEEWLGKVQGCGESLQYPWVVEEQAYGTSHANIGALLFNLWGLPDKIVQAVRWHHQPSRCPTAANRCAIAVHLADGLVRSWIEGRDDLEGCDLLWLANNGVPATVEQWKHLKHFVEDPGCA